MPVHVFGIRHHGPGSARSLRVALETLSPDVVLVEGPPDAESVLPLLASEEMVPPVALLVYPEDEPQRATLFPFALFSPEWQALRFAAARGLPARFIDLPQAHQLAMEKPEPPGGDRDSDDEVAPDDPFGDLSVAAGYEDRELWWEHQVEQRRDATGIFEALLEAVGELRKDRPAEGREAQREAFMRTRIRAAEKEGFRRIAVVCGAWHAPVLAAETTARADQALLKDLPKRKVTSTWIPWTHARLSYRSGYGAGVESPGFYAHLFAEASSAPARWLTQAARLLRAEDLEASSASVIEGVRLAEALAALRDLPSPGLRELNEAALAVLCRGEAAPLALIRRKLEIGEALGRVPKETPAVPLQRDLEAQQKRLRLKATTEVKALDLDLREESGREKSALFHRLRLLGIDWGKPQTVSGKSGTFHEVFTVQWQPEFAVSLVDAAAYGHTVESAANGKAIDLAGKAAALPELTGLLDQAILARLDVAIERLLAELTSRAALAADVRHLMDALPPLARVARYGDVRGTRPEMVLPVFGSLFERITVGLLPACASLDDAAAEAMARSLSRVDESVAALDLAGFRAEWDEVLRKLVDEDVAHGLVTGNACRRLLDHGALTGDELGRRARLALSPSVARPRAAAWVEGLLRGSGLRLLHHDALWTALDEWIVSLATDAFQEVVPLLRRAFSGFSPSERRQMGETVRRLGSGRPAAGAAREAADLDTGRARRVLPVLARILGVKLPEDEP